MSAQIVIDDGTNPPVVGSTDNANAFLSAAHELSNFSDSGILGWRWTLVDKPIGSSAALTSTSAATTELTPDVAGSYLVRLETFSDAARTVLDDSDEQEVAVRLALPLDWRIPAAGETNQQDVGRGWARDVEEILRDIHTQLNNLGGFGTEVWAWDPAQGIAQFDVGAAFSSGLTAPTLSVVDDAGLPSGKKLRLTASGTGTGGAGILITDPIVQLGKILRVEIDVANMTAQYGGLVFLGDVSDSGYFCNYMLQGWRSRIDGGTFASNGTTVNALVAASLRGLARIELNCTKPAAAPPVFTMDGESFFDHATPGSAGGGGRWRMSDEDYATISAFPSGWDALTDLNRMGLALQATGGGSPGTLDIAAMRILDITPS